MRWFRFYSEVLHDPKVLILDEPTLGLDPNQIRETRRLIVELAKRHTIVLSSHILSEVEAICERMIVISDGRIRASGLISEVRNRIVGASRLIAEIRGPKQEIEPGRSDRQTNLASGRFALFVGRPDRPGNDPIGPRRDLQ